jgi:cytochrome c oxidase assembly protein Cox11
VFLLVSSVKTARSRVFSLYGAVKRRERRLGERRVLDVRHIAVHPTASLASVVNRFSPNRYHIVTVIGENARRTLTEEQMLNAVMSGKSGQIGDVFKIFP